MTGSALLGGFRLQLLTFRRGWDSLMAFITVPLVTIAFVAITRHAHRADLEAYAMLAPAVMVILGMAITTSGEVVTTDRAYGTLELAIAAPTSLTAVIFGRVAAVTLTSLVGGVPEVWLVATLLGVRPAVPHPGPLVLAILVGTFAMIGTALLMASVFVAARSARTFQNSLNYPLYLLGGAIVPIAVLPGVVRPICRIVFLSWDTDLLRDCFLSTPVANLWPRLAIVAGLGALDLIVGIIVLRRVLDRARHTGRVGNE